jgi:hypothetical protein
MRVRKISMPRRLLVIAGRKLRVEGLLRSDWEAPSVRFGGTGKERLITNRGLVINGIRIQQNFAQP